jgi:predicted CXXCH cytochrome family protein
MKRRLLKRVVVGLCFALLAMAVVALVGAAAPPAQQQGPLRSDCIQCHESVVTTWDTSAHADALDDPVFQEAWLAADSSPDCLKCHTTGFDATTGTYAHANITCEVCHATPSGPHPEVPMPIDSSSRMCGNCHVDTMAEWEQSTHGEGEMSCIRCHNPHTAAVKTANVDDLCGTCHTQESRFYAAATHFQQGLGCADCHLHVSEGTLGEGHGKRVHTFEVDLALCNRCHGDQMHLPPDVATIHEAEAAYPIEASSTSTLISTASLPVGEEPPYMPAWPINYLLAAGVGLIFGVIVAPWAESHLRHGGNKHRGKS